MTLSFRTRVLLAITLITTLSSFIIAVVFLNQSTQMVEENYILSLWNTMSVSVKAFDDSVRAAYDTAISLSHNEKLAGMIEEYLNGGKRTVDALDISAYLNSFYSDDSIIDQIYLYLPERKQVITSLEYHAVQEIFYPEKHEWLSARHAQPLENGLAPKLVYDEINRSPKYILSYSRVLYCEDSGQPLANIAVNLDERKLFYQFLDTIIKTGEDNYYLIDGCGDIVSAATVKQIGTSSSEISMHMEQVIRNDDRMSVVRDTDGMMIAAVRSPMTGYRIICLTGKQELTAALYEQKWFIFLMLVLTLLVMLIPAYHMSKSMYRPVKNLKDAMQKVSTGDLSVRATVYKNDEIGQLSKGFNEVVMQIETLIGEVVNQRMQKKEAELDALQYQITPHFMYNILNSIKYAAYLRGEDGLGEQLGAFIELLQASISRRGAFLTVQDEVRMVQNYVKLQQFRYMDCFEVLYKIDPASEDCYVPRLLLMPLVENAIIHGHGQQDKGGRIIVTSELVDEMLLLTVQDDGHGMTQDQINALLQQKSARKAGFSGIGIPNVLQRLDLYYGELASLNYYSNNYGTKAVIQLPASMDANEYII